MLMNKTIAEEYFESGRNKKHLIDFLTSELCISNKCAVNGVENWIRQFNRRWAKFHGKERFFERNADWLNSEFKVREQSLLFISMLLLWLSNKK